MVRSMSRIPLSSCSGSGAGFTMMVSPLALISIGSPAFKPTFFRSFLEGSISPLDPTFFRSTRTSDNVISPKIIWFRKIINVSEVYGHREVEFDVYH